MSEYKRYYATNRKHKGSRWQPDGHGKKFSDAGMENLRFEGADCQCGRQDGVKISEHAA